MVGEEVRERHRPAHRRLADGDRAAVGGVVVRGAGSARNRREALLEDAADVDGPRDRARTRARVDVRALQQRPVAVVEVARLLSRAGQSRIT